MGVDTFTVDAPESRAFDVVVEAAGNTAAVETALDAVDKSGKVLLLGISGHWNAAKLYVDEVVNNDVTVRGSFSYTAAAWADTVRLLNAGSFAPAPLITHRYQLDDYQEALDTLASTAGEQPRGKILFDLRPAK
jgi:threonine dehydrogenase-like Zn-dependent dehydrogenase